MAIYELGQYSVQLYEAGAAGYLSELLGENC
jgi:hypothetical protein